MLRVCQSAAKQVHTVLETCDLVDMSRVNDADIYFYVNFK